MQAVVALCHFCEDHGPRVLVTCQPMRSLPMTFAAPSTGTEVSPEQAKRMRRTSHLKEPDKEDIPTYYGDCTRAVYDTEDRCNACTSYGNGPCLLSNDHANKTTYISSQVALKEQVCERVKNACVRSLSCEISVASQESASRATQPIRIAMPSLSESEVFMDFENVKKKDGYLVFGDAETGYCLSYAFRLQDAKARGFLRLFSLLIMTQDMSSMTTNYEFFLEALRIMKDKLQALSSAKYQQEKMELDSSMRPQHASMSARLPSHLLFFDRKVVIDTDRNLQTITGNENIWYILHRQMMWTLRTQTLRYEDQVMEGVPTQDMLVMMEMDHSDIVELDLDQPDQAQITSQQMKNLKIIAKRLSQDTDEDLELLIRQVITGGQVVVESEHKALSKQFILALSNLLPIGCLRIKNYAEQYQPGMQYNMLGCPIGYNIPHSEDVLIIRVIPDGDVDRYSLNNCTFSVIRRPDLRRFHGTPSLLGRYKELLLDNEVVDTVLEATLRCTREQWMSRAKLLYQLEEQRERDPRMNVADLIPLVRGCSEKDRPVLSFWQGGLSKTYKNHVIATIDELREFGQ